MNIGGKIRSLRQMNGMTLEDLATRTDLSKGFLSQVERDLASPSIATLVDLLEALGTTPQQFFSGPDKEQVVFTPENTFESRDDEAGTTIRWLIPNAQKNMMEPILLTLKPGGATPMQDPHRGEEFGHVLSGTVVLIEGIERHRLRRGDSFYIQTRLPHGLQNPGKTEAKVLWISDPPSF